MDLKKNETEKWTDTIPELVESYRSLISISLVEHTSLGISISVIGLLSLSMVTFVFLFISLGFAWWLGEYLGDMKAGFFIVGGFYTLIFSGLVLTSRKVLVPRIRNWIIKKIYEQD